MMKSKVNLKNIIAYVQGWIRFYLYYHPRLKFLIRKHIREQIDFRIKYMDKECYENGSCKLCGCATTALQMADKSCDKPCYPPIVNRNDWKFFIEGSLSIHPIDGNSTWAYFPPYLLEDGTKPKKEDGERLVHWWHNTKCIFFPRKEFLSEGTYFYKVTAINKEGGVISE